MVCGKSSLYFSKLISALTDFSDFSKQVIKLEHKDVLCIYQTPLPSEGRTNIPTLFYISSNYFPASLPAVSAQSSHSLAQMQLHPTNITPLAIVWLLNCRKAARSQSDTACTTDKAW